MASHGTTAALTLALLLTAATLSAAFPAAGTTSGAPRKVLWKDLPADPFCPWDGIKLGACASVLSVVGAQAGAQLGSKCCELVGELAAAEAAACLCITAKETVLGLSTEWTVGVGLLASTCKKELPDGFKCV